ncbi:MAG: M15 family metallopeptidase [Bacteroidetes bacterium]|nr:M15 family metallopeptidase [Bacteroidota bacterium]
MKKYISILVLFLLSCNASWSQEDQLIELKEIIPYLRYDLKYASNQNFTGKRVYPKNTQSSYLVKEAAQSLKNIAKELEAKNLGLLIWDAYRPYRATVKFWKMIHDERYVANPAKGSGHNRGIAVDLTLYEISTGELLEMPTGFDNFSDTAHHDFMLLAEKKIMNRQLLKNTMEKHGFKSLETEWWHYAWPNDRNYPIMNISFKRLNK